MSKFAKAVVPSNTVAGRTYPLTLREGKAVACGCPGFQYRSRCSHVDKYNDENAYIVYYEVFCYARSNDPDHGHSLVRGATQTAASAFADDHNRRCPDHRDRLHVYRDYDYVAVAAA